MRERKKQRQTADNFRSPLKLRLTAEIIEFPNDPERQPPLNNETRWLMLCDRVLVEHSHSESTRD